MEKDDRLEIIWCALNCFVETSVIMREIEKVVGRRAVTQRWSRYFFDSGNSTEAAILVELKTLKRAKKSLTRRSKIRV